MDKNMKQYLDKAEVLIEALPYIQKFNRKVIVVKYGGSAMVDENLKKRVIEDVTLLKLVGFKPIIVQMNLPWNWLRWYWERSTKSWYRW